jgi:two-component system sensor histidine kinase UhpB
VSGAREATARPFVAENIGVVRVTLSPASLIAKQQTRFLVELLMAAFALAVSGTLAYVLGRRLTRDLKASRDLVVKADADKRKLIHKVHSIVEEERKGIAIEIHDELNASLIAVRLESQSILQLANQLKADPVVDQVKLKSQSITKLAQDLYANGRRLVRRLRPEVLDTLGLHGAVEEMVRHYGASRPHCGFDFHSSGAFSALNKELAISAYRIVQEALSNVIKHAEASSVSVSLVLDDQALRIEVVDDGAGFDPAAVSDGIGLIGMRERVAAMEGKIEWVTKPEQGTRVVVELPVPA